MKNLVIILGVIIFALIGTIKYMSVSLTTANKNISRLESNEKAYVNGTKIWKDKEDRYVTESRTFQKTIRDLKYEKDKITKKQNAIINDLKLDIKKLNQVGYVSTKIDTVLVSTKITKDSCYVFDYGPQMKATFCIKDSSATYRPEIANDLSLFFTDKRETIEPPKKFFISRWFQKKHTIVMATAINSNKYVKTDTLQFTYIVKK